MIDHSLFSNVYNPLCSLKIINKDCNKISSWVNQGKMSFNPDIFKNLRELISAEKLTKKQTIPE